MKKREGKEIGACIYCGQFRYFDVDPGEKLTEDEKNIKATDNCNCSEAEYQRNLKKRFERVKKSIAEICVDDEPEIKELLIGAAALIINDKVSKVSIDYDNIKASISLKSNNGIKIERQQKKKKAREV